MGGQESKPNVYKLSTAVGVHQGASFSIGGPKARVVQNFLLVWVDANVKESSKDCQNTLSELRKVVNDISIFTKPEQCIKFLDNIVDEKVFVIVSGSLGEHLVPRIHHLQQLDAIYVFCGNKSRHEIWVKKYKKIRGLYDDIKPICEALQDAARQCDQDSMPMTVINQSEGASNTNINQTNPSFIYTQIFKEILLELEYDKQSVRNLANYCRKLHNQDQLNMINEFERRYQLETPIWWYTRECFAYHMLNRALRNLEGDTIVNMGFFMRDLHKQILELYQKQQIAGRFKKSFTLYRGQGVSNTYFEKLKESNDSLMSFNNFLSTSEERTVALKFIKFASDKTNMIGILFKMTIDPSVSSAPFAFVNDYSSHDDEAEVLFSMHTVFRVGEINRKQNQDLKYYQVDLTLTSNDDKLCRTLTERIRTDLGNETGWRRLGKLLLKLHLFEKAEELYSLLLKQTSRNDERAHFYHQLGFIKDKLGEHEEAIKYYEDELEILEKVVPPNNSLLVSSYNNIGSVYKNMKRYSDALSFYQKAVETHKKSSSANPLDLAYCYNNIGSVYSSKNEYSKALPFYEKSLEIRQKNLSSNDPDLATSYNNIGFAHRNMQNYSKALKYYEHALKILQISLPSNHAHIKAVQENIKLIKEKF